VDFVARDLDAALVVANSIALGLSEGENDMLGFEGTSSFASIGELSS
jgi:hypothetical protein